MGNKFGSFPSRESAEAAIVAEGFHETEQGLFAKRSVTGGSLSAEPRACTALVEITAYRVDGRYAADGEDYHVYQHHFI